MSKLNKDNLIGLREIKDLISCGVYFLTDKDENVVYIGKSKNFYLRLQDHIESSKIFDRIFFYPCKVSELNEVEQELILEYKPIYNKTLSNSGYITKEVFRENIIKLLNKKLPSYLLNTLLQKFNIEYVEFNNRALLPSKGVKIIVDYIRSNEDLYNRLRSDYSVERERLKGVEL